MKKVFIIICALVVGIANADNVITSKEYVDTQGATLQPQVQAKNTNTVLTYPAAGTAAPGEKAIYDSSAAYGEQSDTLVTAGQFNNALQVALDTEFVCVSRNDQGCLLYEIHSASQKQTLPAGYTQLEYLESSGTQYIDTGISPDLYTRVDYKVRFLDNETTSGAPIIGARVGRDNYNRFLPISYSFGGQPVNVWRTVFGNSQRGDTYIDFNINYEGSFQPKHQKSIVNGVTYSWAKITFRKDEQNTIYLFATSGYSESLYNSKGRIYYVKIYVDSENLSFNGIPARRDSDGVLGMYDTVSGTFFTNSGTGTFIAGPVFSYLPQGN